jgi:hypothetical protein
MISKQSGFMVFGILSHLRCFDKMFGMLSPQAVGHGSSGAPARQAWVITPEVFVNEAIREAVNRVDHLIQFNAVQLDFLALIVVTVQQKLGSGDMEGFNKSQPHSEVSVPKINPLRIFLGGLCGAGKSERIYIVGRLVEMLFGQGSKRVFAVSKPAASAFGCDAVLRGLFLSGQCNFLISSRSLPKVPSLLCQEAWMPVKAVFLEEGSMISLAMLAGISYRLCRARCFGRPWLDHRLYEDDQHMYGGMPIVVLLGDFMQLGFMMNPFILA